MKTAPAIDLAHRLLHLLGWSVGEAGFRMPSGSRYWQVDAAKDGQVVVATAESQGKAWWECLRFAGIVERDAARPTLNCNVEPLTKSSIG